MIKCNRCEWNLTGYDNSNSDFVEALCMSHYESHRIADILSSNFTRIKDEEK